MRKSRFREVQWRGWSFYWIAPLFHRSTFFTQFGFAFGVRRYPMTAKRR